MQYAEALLQRAAKHSCINAYAHVENNQASIQCLSSQVWGSWVPCTHDARLDLLPQHTLCSAGAGAQGSSSH